MSKKILIIGNGVAGVSAALGLRSQDPNAEIHLISGESELHFSRPALMYIFMGHMKLEDTYPYPPSFWKRQNIKIHHDWVIGMDIAQKTIELESAGTFDFDILILATGSIPNKFSWPGEDLGGVQGLYHLQDLDLLEESVKSASRAVIVGGGLIGIELAEMLHARGLSVTFLVREKSYWSNILTPEESAMVNRIIRKEGIELRLETSLKEIIDDGNGRCCAIVTGSDERIECQIVGLTPGVRPNVSLAKSSGLDVDRGIVVDEYFATSATDIYAIGDCAQFRLADGSTWVDQLWYTAKAQGENLAKNLMGSKTPYRKPIFYNSAKFFDVEYQTYGEVPREGDDIRHFYWESSCGRRSLRLVADAERFIGMNTMGIRYRHRTFEAWLRDALTIDEVLERLSEANFDPEFYQRYEPEIRTTFREQRNSETASGDL